jgi:hypothetical protein
MEKYEKIIARLEAAKDAYDAVHLAARRAGEPEQGNPAYNEVGEEYCRAWDAAGVIWQAACREEATGNRTKAQRLWSLLAPYDDEAVSHLVALF